MTLALRRSGLEDYEVAEKANVTAAWLSAVKNDRIKTPPLDKLRAVAEACGVPLRYLTEPMGIIPLSELRDNDWGGWDAGRRPAPPRDPFSPAHPAPPPPD